MRGSPWISGIFLALVAVAILAYLATPLLPNYDDQATKQLELIIGAVSAIGTVFAALIALHLGLSTQQEQYKRDTAVAKIVAAKITVDLIPFESALKACIFHLPLNSSDAWKFECIKKLFVLYDKNPPTVTDEDLIRLAPAGRNVSVRLAFVQSSLQQVRRSIAMTTPEFMAQSENMRQQLLAYAIQRVHVCFSEVSHISPIVRDFGDLSRTYGPNNPDSTMRASVEQAIPKKGEVN